ncbi:MAG: glycosyltransferase family 1 protein [Candidatus Hydrogenedentes bacterium]|nr:glycosyltransferase family 1 protein [Candidatus Hydrogenedentota bacterium]
MTDAAGTGIPESLVRALTTAAGMIPCPDGKILCRGARAVETALLLKRKYPSATVWAQPDDSSPWRAVSTMLDGLLEGPGIDAAISPDTLVFTGATASFRSMIENEGVPASCLNVLAIVSPDPPELPGAWIPARVESRDPWHLNLWLAADPLPEIRALRLVEAGRDGDALRLLMLIHIPAVREIQVLRERLILTCLRTMAARGEISPQLALGIAQRQWFCLLALQGETDNEFRLMAEMWNLAGEPENALKHLALISPDQPVPPRAAGAPDIGNTARPDTPPPWPRRVLFLLPRRAHYGLDVLYEGLCDALGDANVVDYPRKPTLHGARDPQLANYPCQIDRGAAPIPFDDLLEQVRSRRFDLIFQGILEMDEWIPEAGELLRAASGHTPITLVDAMDEMDDFRETAAIITGGLTYLAYLKRERARVCDYGPEVIPFPFAYPDRLIPDEETVINARRDVPLFWAGKEHGLRRHWLEHARRITGQALNASYPPDQYKACLLRSQAGLNLAGAGFDTVRYWEIPAHGALLISETLPIEIPWNFRHGVDAFFFRTPNELAEIWAWSVAHPEDAREMALAGYTRLRTRHGARARALQMLWAIHEIARRKGLSVG